MINMIDMDDIIVYYYPDRNIQLEHINKLLKHEQEAIKMIDKMLSHDTIRDENVNNKINYYKNIEPFKKNVEKFYIKGIYICLEKNNITCEIQHYYSKNCSYWIYEFKKKINNESIISCVWYGDTNRYI